MMNQQVSSLLEELEIPNLKINILTKGEGFKIDNSGDVLSLEAAPEMVLDGIYHASAAIKSGQMAETEGWISPKYPLRPLFLKQIGNIKKIRRLGYNAVVVDEEIEKIEGLEVILRVRGKCALEDDFNMEFSENTDYIFWESDFEHWNPRKYDRDALLYDCLLKEVQILENCLPEDKKLIYFLPYSQTYSAEDHVRWLLDLCDDVGERTILSFSMVAGSPEKDYLLPHPFWTALRKKEIVASTPFLPVINVGCLEQGEGLWPVLTFDAVEECFSRMYRHNFIGAMSLASQLPREGALLDCNLWVAGHRMWKDVSASLLAESWFNMYLSDWNFEGYCGLFREIRKMAQKIAGIREEKLQDEEYKLEFESLFAKLNQWGVHFGEGGLSDYLRYFIRDAKRMLLHHSQEMKIPFHAVLTGDDLEPGFWSKAEGSKGGGSTIVELFSAPDVDTEDLKMTEIYSQIYTTSFL